MELSDSRSKKENKIRYWTHTYSFLFVLYLIDFVVSQNGNKKKKEKKRKKNHKKKKEMSKLKEVIAICTR